MRTITAAQQGVIDSGVQAEWCRVSIKDGGGTFRDLSTYPGFDALQQVQWKEDIEGPHMTADIVLSREFYDLSLNPFMSGSALNKGFNPSGSYSALIALNREVKIEVAIVAMDKTPASGDWMEVFRGRIDTLDPASDWGIRISCRGLAGRLAQQYIKQELVYSYCEVGGVAKAAMVWTPGVTVPVGKYMIPATRGSGDSGYNRFFVSSQAGVTGSSEPIWGTGTAIPDDADGGTLEWDYVGAPTTAGNPVEEIIQNLLDDHKASGDPTVTLYVPSSPGWAIRQFLQQRTYVLEAVRALATQIGWDLRYKWRSGTSQFEFTLYQPNRSSPSVDHTFVSSEYEKPTQMVVDIANIRNAWRVIYSDRSDLLPDGTPKRKVIEVSDSSSITKYGELWAEIQEDSNSQIDSSTEATALANAALSDCKEPNAEMSVKLCHGFPWTEINDYYTFGFNDLTFDASQSLAVTGVTQSYEGSKKKLTTSLQVRGVPTIGSGHWVGRTNHPALAQLVAPHRMTHFNGPDTAVATLRSEVGGFTATMSQTLDKQRLVDDEIELHVSTEDGFTTDDTTLKAIVRGGSGVAKSVGDLVPRKTHYVRTVQRFYNNGRMVRGQPSAQQTIVSGQAKAAHYDSLVSQGHFPLNGNFEHASDDLSTKPFDQWDVVSGTWGSSDDLYYGTDATYGYYVSLRQTGGDPQLRSTAFPVRRNAGHFNIYTSVRPQGTLVAGRGLMMYVRFYRKSDLSDTPILFTQTIPYNVAAANVWTSYIVNSQTIGVVPNDVNFVTITFGKEAISSAYGFDIGDVFFCEAQQEDLWATTRAFIPTLYGTGTTTPASIYTEPLIVVNSGGSAPAFATNWGNVGAGYQTCAFYKDSYGVVHLQGQPKITTGTLTTTIFTLPSGYRPTNIEQYPLRMGTGALAYLEIDTTGVVGYCRSGGGVLADAQSGLGLAGITFRT